MNRLIVAAAAVLVFLVAGTGYWLLGRSHELRLSEAQLQQALEARLPVSRVFRLIVEVRIEHATLSLLDDSNRVRGEVDVALNLLLGRSGRPLIGSLAFSSGIRYAPQQGQFFLDAPLIERVVLPGIPQRQTEKVRESVAGALSEFLSRTPVYTLKDDDVRQAAARLVLQEVRVDGKELVLRMGLAPSR